MIGNQHCEPQCNNEACHWDGFDCGCAPQCDVGDYGSCSSACLVPDCNYDQLPGFPQCTEESLRIAALYYHLMVRNFSLPFFLSSCEDKQCTGANWTLSQTSCVKPCNVLECSLSFANCQLSPCVSLQHCQICQLSAASGCLQCSSGYLQFFSTCVLECPAGYHVHPLVTTICYPDSDWTNATHPFPIFVSATQQNSGVGTSSNPYSSLSAALDAIRMHYSVIYLLAGTHFLSPTVSSPYLSTWSPDASSIYPHLSIIVTGARCEFLTHPECASSNPLLIVNNLSPVQWQITGKVAIEGVDFSGNTSLVSGCGLPLCTYCPVMTLDSKGSGVDDRGLPHVADSFGQNCSSFASKSFITLLPNSELSLNQATISNFREGYASLISLISGNLTISNTSFFNITISSGVDLSLFPASFVPLEAVIHQSNPGPIQYQSGSIKLANLTVSFLNNGYEYSDSLQFGGFLSASGIRYIDISDSHFGLNFVPRSILIYVGNVTLFSIARCSFDMIYTGYSLIAVIPRVTLLELADAYMSHISISDTLINRCSASAPGNANGSLLMFGFNSNLLNILLENVTLLNTFTQVSAVNIMNFGSLNSEDISGATVVARTATSRSVLFFPSKWVRITNLLLDSAVTNSVTSMALLHISSVCNIELLNVTIRNSGDSLNVASVNTKTVMFLIDSAELYISRPIPVSWSHCVHILTLSSTHNVSLSNSSLSNNTCLSGTSGIHTEGPLTGNFTVSKAAFVSLFGYSADASSCLQISTSGYVALSRIEARANTLSTAGCIRIQASAGNVLRDSLFIDNVSQAALIQVISGASLIVRNTTLVSNSGPSQVGIFFSAAPKLLSAQVKISDCLFVNNSGSSGTCIWLTNDQISPSTLRIEMRRSQFVLNIGTIAGTILNIDSTNRLSNDSVIQNCQFRNNTSSRALISLASKSGTLWVDRSEFAGTIILAAGKLGQDVANIEASYQSTSADNTVLYITNSLITLCQGTAMVKLSASNSNSYLVSSNNTFINNGGRSFAVDRACISDQDSVYIGNLGASFWMTSSSSANVTSAYMKANSGYYTGAVYLGGNSSGVFTTCVLDGNKAQTSAGAIFVEQYSTILVNNSTFRNNHANTRGSGLSLFGSLADNTITNCTFEDNSSVESATIYCSASNLRLDHIILRTNSAPVAPGIQAYFCTVSVTNSMFSDQQSSSGVFIYAAIDTVVNVSMSSFSNGKASLNGGALFLLSATILISSSSFARITANKGALLYANSNSTFRIVNSAISEVSANLPQGGIANINEGLFLMEDIKCGSYANGGIVGFDMSSLILHRVEFTGNAKADGEGSQGGAVYCSNCAQLEIRSSSFSSLTAEEGAAFYFIATVSQPSALISDTTFAHLTGTLSGAIVLASMHSSIDHCVFLETQAIGLTGAGGALSLSCTNLLLGCTVSIQNSVFQGNSAGEKGGSIYWSDSKPALNNNSYSDGSAAYGKDIASYPIGIRIDSIFGNASVENFGKDGHSVSIEGTLLNVPSGQNSGHVLTFSLYDHYGQTVSTVVEGSASLSGGNPLTSVIGNTSAVANQGTFTFAGFGVIATPGSDTIIYIDTGLISSTQLDNVTRVSRLALLVQMRTCEVGESLTGIQCVICPSSKFSLNASMSCQDCPIEAICYGNYTMVPKAGYWRFTMWSMAFWPCPYPASCLGSPEPPEVLSYTGLCAAGYYGNLCSGCLSGYSKQHETQCVQCPSKALNSLEIVAVGIGLLILTVVIVKTAINSARKKRALSSVFIKIMINYIQLTTLTASFDLKWPNYMKELFAVQSNAGEFTDRAFSVDCLLASSEPDNEANALQVKMIVVTFVPIVLFGASVLFWCPFALFKRNFSYLKNELVATNVVSFFLVNPTIVKLMFGYLHCRQLDNGVLWLVSDLNIRCWETSHYRYVLVLALPSIIVWVIGVPLCCLGVLHVKREKLDSGDLKMRLGFLYTGYNPNQYYWEFVILYRKIMIICVYIFLGSVDIAVQALTVMVILFASFGVQLRHKPYFTAQLNHLEARSILVSAVTIYCGLYYLTGKLDASTEIGFFVAVVVMNAYYIALWLFRVTPMLAVAVLKYCPCLKKFLSLGSKKRNHKVIPVKGGGESKSVSKVSISPYEYENHSSFDFGSSLADSRVIVPENTAHDIIE